MLGNRTGRFTSRKIALGVSSEIMNGAEARNLLRSPMDMHTEVIILAVHFAFK